MSFTTGYQGVFNASQQLIISSGLQESAALDCGGMVLSGIILPTAFTSTALTFEVSSTLAGTYVPLKSTISGTALSYTVAQATYCAIDPKDFQGVRFLKIKSGSAEAADRILILSLKGF